jgi:membrane fusion protein
MAKDMIGHSSFFRTEMLQNHDFQYGRVLIYQPWGYSVAVLVALVIIMMVAVFLYCGSYTRKAKVVGVLMPESGILRLVSGGGGMITEVNAVDGQDVMKGVPLFTVSSERASASGETQESIGKRLTERLDLFRINRNLLAERLVIEQDSIDARMKNLNRQLESLREQRELSTKQIGLAKANMLRQQKLLDSEFISMAQLQTTEMALLTLQADAQTLARDEGGMEQQRIQLIEERQQAKLRHNSERANVDNSIALVSQERAENDVKEQEVIKAPFAGTVAGMNAQVGQRVLLGTTLATLFPATKVLKAYLYASPSQVGFVKKGQRVIIRYAAYPYQKFGMGAGTVAHVADTPYASQELPSHIANIVTVPNGINIFFKVSVDLDRQDFDVYGVSQKLRPGMLLEADVIQEKRQLYEWLLEPIFAIGKRLEER